MYGCPLLNFAQQFFFDFQTGTTADNIYAVVALDHRFSAGEFTTQAKLAPLDAYGKYISLAERMRNVSAIVNDIADQETSETGEPS